MRIISTIEKLSTKSSHVDLAGAVAAGVCAGAVTSLVNAFYRELNFLAYARWILLAVAAYFFVASMSRQLWPKRFRRIVPVWLMTAFLGSVLFVAGNLLPGVIKGWYDPYRLERSLGEYILTELDAAKSVLLLLNLITIPITATFHHAEQIIRGIKAWHEGPVPLSISGGTPIKEDDTLSDRRTYYNSILK